MTPHDLGVRGGKLQVGEPLKGMLKRLSAESQPRKAVAEQIAAHLGARACLPHEVMAGLSRTVSAAAACLQKNEFSELG